MQHVHAKTLTLLGVGLILGLVGGGLHLSAREPRLQPVRDQRHSLAPRASYADVLAPILPAVVNIQALSEGGERSPLGWFFGSPEAPQDESQGSGVIVRSDGIILTNYHVVQGADSVLVTLNDRSEMRARVVGADPASDLAVLRVRASGLPTVPFGNDETLRVGDVVFAIGNPLAIGQTVTSGIVSAKQRHVNINDYNNFIQTDAAINPGNSGGALVDSNGQLVGINSAIIYRGTPAFQGIGLAIPMSMAARVLDQILADGRVTRGWLGITLDEVGGDDVRQLGLKRPIATVVQAVRKGEPAHEAGMARGDVVLSLDGKDIASLQQFRLAVSDRSPGDRINLGILRDGERIVLSPVLGERPGNAERRWNRDEIVQPDDTYDEWGLELSSLRGRDREELSLSPNEGVLVRNVQWDSAASRAGLKKGDVIVSVERRTVGTPTDLARLAGSEDEVLLRVLSGKEVKRVVLRRE